MRFFCLLLALLSTALADVVQVPLFAQKPGESERFPLATLAYDKETTNLTVVDVNYSLEENAYCIGAEINKEFSCFSYVKIKLPLAYDLYVETKHGSYIPYKLSLKPNPDSNGIVPVLRVPTPGPEAPAIKLKKVTKTYPTAKAELGSATAAFEEDIEPDNRNFIQKNWKYIVIGLVLYSITNAGRASNDGS